MNKTTKIALLIAVGIILVGCNSNKEKTAWEDPFFPPDKVRPPSKVIQDRQAAVGAAADAMLFDIHFDGAELNSLGQQKLSLMVQGKRPTVPLKVYLNMPKDADAGRQASVEKALEVAGLPKEQYAVAFGPNPAVLMPAEAGIRALAPAGPAANASGVDMSGSSTNTASAEK